MSAKHNPANANTMFALASWTCHVPRTRAEQNIGAQAHCLACKLGTDQRCFADTGSQPCILGFAKSGAFPPLSQARGGHIEMYLGKVWVHLRCCADILCYVLLQYLYWITSCEGLTDTSIFGLITKQNPTIFWFYYTIIYQSAESSCQATPKTGYWARFLKNY